MEPLKIYAQILIAHYTSILKNIRVHFSLKCPKKYILRYQFIKLDKNAKIMMSIFNGCRTKFEFFTVCIIKSPSNLHDIFVFVAITSLQNLLQALWQKDRKSAQVGHVSKKPFITATLALHE